ncbi:hypothetical protein HB364_25745 [Pseudoflavitalea sp. X16]|uniref:type VI-B CRISPR accessory protein Csx27 n=1 Tax=Paraflavitalea devenefica TaxID=2716334 RepID=UPI00141DD1A1|nr:CRISPR-associated protein Csx27 [Paraflavitalea devenefica]NII28513.1 hypothetical protein [Paraflavitalea devenefica]
MDKLSLYEFLSFFLPGITVIYIMYQVMPAGYGFLKPSTDLLDGLMISIIALATGLLVHSISFLWLKYKWYKWLVYPSVNCIVAKDKETIKINYRKLKENEEHKNDTAEEIFDKAYWYLEYHGKIDTAKMFQSMYFFLRNMVTLCLLMIPVLSLSLIFFYSFNTILFIVILFLSLFAISTIANFYRRKMVGRIFGNYVIALKT